mmetsp:Transcript_29023/g.33155  ORF Transcript_29023/g.33155 Transcript_29023/m.33155 type:complete len:130 (+) Transcript_29023:3-392(+)
MNPIGDYLEKDGVAFHPQSNRLDEKKSSVGDLSCFNEVNTLIAMKKLKVSKAAIKNLATSPDKFQVNAQLRADINLSSNNRMNNFTEVKGGNIFFGGNTDLNIQNSANGAPVLSSSFKGAKRLKFSKQS